MGIPSGGCPDSFYELICGLHRSDQAIGKASSELRHLGRGDHHVPDDCDDPSGELGGRETGFRIYE